MPSWNLAGHQLTTMSLNTLWAEPDLIASAATNDVNRVRKLLAAGVNPNMKTPLGWTALHSAAEHGYAAIAGILLKTGINPNEKANMGMTPLHLAAQNNHLAVAALLLAARGIDRDPRRVGRFTPLHLAAMCGHADMVALLADNNADLHATCEQDDTPYSFSRRWLPTPLHLAVLCRDPGRRARTTRALLNAGADPQASNELGCTPLYLACAARVLESEATALPIVALLLAAGACPNESGEQTPLERAAFRGHARVAKLLLSHSAIRIRLPADPNPRRGDPYLTAEFPSTVNLLADAHRRQLATDAAALFVLLADGHIFHHPKIRAQAVLARLPPELQGLVALRVGGRLRIHTLPPPRIRASALHLLSCASAPQ